MAIHRLVEKVLSFLEVILHIKLFVVDNIIAHYPFSNIAMHTLCSLLHQTQSTILNQVGWSNNIAGLELHTLHLTWQPTCFAAGVSERGSLS